MRPVLSSLLMLPLLLQAAPDPRFGFVGTGGKAFAQKFAVSYYTLEGNYPVSGTIFSSVDTANDPPVGQSVFARLPSSMCATTVSGKPTHNFKVPCKLTPPIWLHGISSTPVPSRSSPGIHRMARRWRRRRACKSSPPSVARKPGTPRLPEPSGKSAMSPTFFRPSHRRSTQTFFRATIISSQTRIHQPKWPLAPFFCVKPVKI